MPQKVGNMASIGDQLAESTHEFKSIPTDSNISQNLHLTDSSHLPALPKQSTPPDHSNDILGIYLSEIGRIPKNREVFFLNIGQIKIIKASLRKIERIQLYLNK